MRNTPLERKTELRRGPGPKRKSSRPPSDALREKMEAFKGAVIDKICRACGRWWDPYTSVSHHVVYRQHLPVEMEWDPRNALPLCDDCHERHHNASRRVALAALTDKNLEFAREVLGEAADGYLERRYLPVGASQ